MKTLLGVAALALSPLLITPAGTQETPLAAASLQVSVTPGRTPDGKLTGSYVASVSVVAAPKARLAYFQLNLPSAYSIDKTAQGVGIKGVQPGPDVLKLDLNAKPTPTTTDDTPVLFADAATSAGVLTLGVAALLKDETKTPKSVCQIVFTARGRPTATPLAFPKGGVSVQDATLAVLTSKGTFATVAVPVFGDLNWDGGVDALDLALLAQATREFNASHKDLPLADLAPYAGGPNPAAMISKGDKKVDAADLAALLKAWQAYNQKHAALSAAEREGAR